MLLCRPIGTPQPIFNGKPYRGGHLIVHRVTNFPALIELTLVLIIKKCKPILNTFDTILPLDIGSSTAMAPDSLAPYQARCYIPLLVFSYIGDILFIRQSFHTHCLRWCNVACLQY